MAKLKQLKQHDEIFYPITVGEAVIFKDSTNAEVSEQEMEEIFDWSGNWIEFTKTQDSDNYILIEQPNYNNDEYTYKIHN